MNWLATAYSLWTRARNRFSVRADSAVFAGLSGASIPNPLAKAFPALYSLGHTPDAGHLQLCESILADYQALTAEFWGAVLRPQEQVVLRGNLATVLSAPAVRLHFISLRGNDMQAYYQRTLLLFSLAQLCILRGGSKTSKKFAAGLPYVLLGIAMRFIELPKLPLQARKTLADARTFDWRDGQQLKARVLQCRKIRDIEENLLAQKGLKRFLALACPVRNPYTSFTIGIIRYCGRLTGRTATEYGQDIICRIPEIIGYIEMLDNVASAWVRLRKPPVLVLAEEYGRVATEKYYQVSGEVTKRNEDALKDLMQVLNICKLENFQDSGKIAFYMPACDLLVRSEKSSSEEKASGRRSARHSRRLKRNSERAGHAMITRDSSRLRQREHPFRATAQKAQSDIWRCYRMHSRINLNERTRLFVEGREATADPRNDKLELQRF